MDSVARAATRDAHHITVRTLALRCPREELCVAQVVETEKLRMTARLRQAVADGLAGLRELFNGAAQPNRRREQHTSFTGSVIVLTASGTQYHGICRDLSAGGMGALVSAPLEIGQQVRISYKHPALGKQMAFATVKQRHGYRYGFAFTDTIHKHA